MAERVEFGLFPRIDGKELTGISLPPNRPDESSKKVFPIFDVRRRWVASKAAVMLQEAATAASRDAQVYDLKVALAIALKDVEAVRKAWNSGQALFPGLERRPM